MHLCACVKRTCVSSHEGYRYAYILPRKHICLYVASKEAFTDRERERERERERALENGVLMGVISHKRTQENMIKICV